MWIKMNEDYIGGIGTFTKGEKYDLPPRLLRCIPEFVPQSGHKDKPSTRKYYEQYEPTPKELEEMKKKKNPAAGDKDS